MNEEEGRMTAVKRQSERQLATLLAHGCYQVALARGELPWSDPADSSRRFGAGYRQSRARAFALWQQAGLHPWVLMGIDGVQRLRFEDEGEAGL